MSRYGLETCVVCGRQFTHVSRHLAGSECGTTLFAMDEGALGRETGLGREVEDEDGMQASVESIANQADTIPAEVQIPTHPNHQRRKRRRTTSSAMSISNSLHDTEPALNTGTHYELDDYIGTAMSETGSHQNQRSNCPRDDMEYMLSHDWDHNMTSEVPMNNTVAGVAPSPFQTAIPTLSRTQEEDSEGTPTEPTTWYQTVSEQQSSLVVAPADRSLARLHQLCDKAGAPRYLAEKLMQVLTSEMQRGFDPLNDHLSGRKSLMRRLQMAANLPKPEAIQTSLESGTKVTIFRFPFLPMLQNHLLSPVYGNTNNISVDEADIWSPISNSRARSAEMHDFSWFQETSRMYQQENTTSGKFLLHPLIIYTDKTGTDKIEKNSLEPVMITSSVIKGTHRETASNWFPLGFVPNLSLSSSAERALHKGKKKSRSLSLRDYHRCLDILLQPLRELQRRRPMMRFRRGNQIATFRIIAPIAAIVGDNLACDRLCGRMSYYGEKSPRLSRRCLTCYVESDVTPHICNPVNGDFIRKLSMGALGCCYGQVALQGEVGEFTHTVPAIPPSPNFDWWARHLDRLPRVKRRTLIQNRERREAICDAILHKVFCSHSVDNAFFKVDFGATKQGIHAAALSDILHTVEEGIVPNILDLVFGVMPTKQRTELDQLVESLLNIHFNRSGERDLFPRVSFTRGYSQLTLLSADERVGQLFVLALLLHMEEGCRLLEPRFHLDFDKNRLRRSRMFLSQHPTTSTAHGTGYPEMAEHQDQEEPLAVEEEHPSTSATPLSDHEIKHFLSVVDLEYVYHTIRPNLPAHHQGVLMETLRKTIRPQWVRGVVHDHLPRSCLDYLNTEIVLGGPCPGPDEEEPEADPQRGSMQGFDCQREREACSIRLDRAEFLYLVETTLTMHSFLKYGLEQPFPEAQGAFKKAMDLLRHVVVCGLQRGEGTNGWKLQKFLELSHFVQDWCTHGPPSGYSTSSGERGLKSWAKAPANTAQKRDDTTFSKQVVARIYESMVLEAVVVSSEATAGEEPKSSRSPSLGARLVYKQDDKEGAHVFFMVLPSGKLTRRHKIVFPEVVQEWFASRYGSREEAIIHITTEVDILDEDGVPTTRLRAHPDYQARGPWYDFAMVRYEVTGQEYQHFPCRCVCFFQEHKQGGEKWGPWKVLVQECDYQTPQQKERKSQILTHWRLRATPVDRRGRRKAVLSVIDQEEIEDRIMVIETERGLLNREGGKVFNILWLKYRQDEWPQSFLDSPSYLPGWKGVPS